MSDPRNWLRARGRRHGVRIAGGALILVRARQQQTKATARRCGPSSAACARWSATCAGARPLRHEKTARDVRQRLPRPE